MWACSSTTDVYSLDLRTSYMNKLQKGGNKSAKSLQSDKDSLISERNGRINKKIRLDPM